MAGEINFPTDTAELTSVATNDLIPIYDVSAPGDLKEAQAINIAKTLIDDTSTTATDRTWSASKVISYILTKVLTGFTVAGTRTAIVDTDTILSAFGKAQKYFNDLSTLAFSGSANDLTGTKTSAFISDFSEATEDIIGGKVKAGTGISVAYNDTNGETTITNTIQSRAILQSTRASQTASGTISIAHGLSVTPTFCSVEMKAGGGASTNRVIHSSGFSDGTTNKCSYNGIDYSSNFVSGNSSNKCVYFANRDAGGGEIQEATITFDATNVNIIWTFTNDGLSTYEITAYLTLYVQG